MSTGVLAEARGEALTPELILTPATSLLWKKQGLGLEVQFRISIFWSYPFRKWWLGAGPLAGTSLYDGNGTIMIPAFEGLLWGV